MACRYVMHGPGDTCDCKARLASVTTHTRTSTPQGPDYCAECSAALGEWVPWPCTDDAAPEATDPTPGEVSEFHCDICGSDTHDDIACSDVPVRVAPMFADNLIARAEAAEAEVADLRAKVAQIRAVLFLACHHCGRLPDQDGDHSCFCPTPDSECLHHTLNPVAPLEPIRAALGGEHA